MLQPQGHDATEPYKDDARASCSICCMTVVRQEMCRLSRKVERPTVGVLSDLKWLAATSMKKCHH